MPLIEVSPRSCVKLVREALRRRFWLLDARPDEARQLTARVRTLKRS
jgi:autonomous glycyl radical cofactor GrcA